jgi:hypothetical protein
LICTATPGARANTVLVHVAVRCHDGEFDVAAIAFRARNPEAAAITSAAGYASKPSLAVAADVGWL